MLKAQPKGISSAPSGLKTRLILTLGDSWKWYEGIALAELKPGETITVVENVAKIPDVDNVRKIGIRIESKNLAYKGYVCIDNVRVY